MPKKQSAGSTSVALVMAVLALALGVAAGYALSGKQRWKAGYDAGKTEAKTEIEERLRTAGILRPDPDQRSIGGIVKSIEGTTLVVETRPTTPLNPLAEAPPTIRTITVSATTTIVRVRDKSSEELGAEQKAFLAADEAFRKSAGTGETPNTEENAKNPPTTPEPPKELQRPPEPPSVTKTEKATLADITVGSYVEVTASESIFRAASFEAKELRLVHQATTGSSDTTTAQEFPEPDPTYLKESEVPPQPTLQQPPEPSAPPPPLQ